MLTYEQEHLCREIVERAQDAIIFADGDGVIRLWNSGAVSIFGYSTEAALGETLDLIIPEKLRERHWQGYRNVMRTGVSKYGSDLLAVPATRSDGSRISIEFTVSLVYNSKGELSGTAAIVRDVTERWKREKELKKRLAELEEREKKM